MKSPNVSQPIEKHHRDLGRRRFLGGGMKAGAAAVGSVALLGAATGTASAAVVATRSVVDYHNGGSDWTAAFQAAIDAANPTNGRHGGGVVAVPAGSYTVAGNIRVHTGVQIVGEGWGSQVRLANGANAALFTIDETTGPDGKPAFATGLRGLRLNGNRNKQTQQVAMVRVATGSGTTPIFNDHRHTIGDLFMQYGAGHGIEIVGTRATRVDNVLVTKCVGAGVLTVDASDGLFSRIVSAGNGSGFTIDGASNNLLACRASRNTADGFLITSSRSAITNGYSLDNGRDGYRVQGFDTNLTGCVADSNREAGLRIDGVKRAVVTGLSSYSRVGSDNGSSPFVQRVGVVFNNTGQNMVTGLVRQNTVNVQGDNGGGLTQLVDGG